MTPDTRKVINYILKLIKTKDKFLFWFFIRFISTLFPVLSIYLFSRIISILENHGQLSHVIFLVISIFVIYIFENFTKNLSIARLECVISNIQFDVHNFFIPNLTLKDKPARHEAIQAIRNLSDAVGITLKLFRQPGIDSLVSILVTPVIIYFIDPRIFVLVIAYIVVYYFIDIYTTQRYVYVKNLHNAKVESYYAQLQDSNDISLEETQYGRLFTKLANWGFTEQFSLQVLGIVFYSVCLLFLIMSVLSGHKTISDLVLIIGYVSTIQTVLHSLGDIKDKLADTKVGLYRLEKSRSLAYVDLDDLVR